MLQGLVGSLSRSVHVITIPVGAVVPILLSIYQSLSLYLYTNVKKQYRKRHKDFVHDKLSWNWSRVVGVGGLCYILLDLLCFCSAMTEF